MSWTVVMDEDGVITLPPDLLAALGWTSETPLRWSEEDGGICFGSATPDPVVA